MPSTLIELTFVENSQLVVYPAGTQLKLVENPSEESRICDARVREYKNRKDHNYAVWILNDRPRILHRKVFDPRFMEQSREQNRRVAEVALGSGDGVGRAGLPVDHGNPEREDRRVEPSVAGHCKEAGISRDGKDGNRGSDKKSTGPASAAGVKPKVANVSTAVQMLEHTGIVAVIDTMNVLTRHFHGQEESEIHAVRGLLDTTRQVIAKLSPEYVVFALEGGYTERTKLLPSYKSGRSERPELLRQQIELAEIAIASIGWPAIQIDGWEADDVIASMAWQLRDLAAGVIVVSTDKDLTQLLPIPGVAIYHPWDGGKMIAPSYVKEKYGVTPRQMVDYLSLVGDVTDRVPGVTGIGPKTAAAWLEQYKTLDAILASGEKKIQSQEAKDSAIMSRKLIELNRELPLPTDWQKHPVAKPLANWRTNLEKIGLAAPANRLAEALNPSSKKKAG